MKKIREVELEIPKNEIRCFFCYCSMKNEVSYLLDDIRYYHYDCLIEKFRVNDVEEFELYKLNGEVKEIKVPPESKKIIR